MTTEPSTTRSASPSTSPSSASSESSSDAATGHAAPGRATVFDIVTEKILGALERGTVPWRRPWRAPALSIPRNLTSGKPYRGINFFLLTLGGEAFGSPFWLTFRQARGRGGSVRKGERGTPIFFWKVHDSDDDGDASDDAPGRRFVARYYTVFNVEQCEGIAALVPQAPAGDVPHVEACERIVAGYAGGPTIVHGGSQALYAPLADRVRIPERGAFSSAAGYYATLFHELTHSTGHPSRLARFTAETPPAPFGTPDYSREELVAEMGSAFLCAEAGIGNDTLESSAAYLAGWLRVLRSDKRAVIVAAAAARRAADLVLGSSPMG